jgi:nucleoside-diphosphate-sugar epimerase
MRRDGRAGVKILCTGDAGFIGTHLVRELAEHGHHVTGLDWKRSTSEDITCPGIFERALVADEPDAVIHLAAQYGRLKGEQDIDYTIRENAIGTAHVARACGTYGVPVLYTSTSEIYGDQGETELTEDTPPVLPHNAYGLTKRFGEELLRLYAPDGLQIVRLSMPYGPGGKPGWGMNALHNVLHQALKREPIVIHKGAERSWVWVGDAVRALRLILESKRPGLWNVGREDDRRSMLEIAQKACALTGCPEDLIELVDPPKAQTVVKRMNVDRLIAEFGWQPTVELEEGLPFTLHWLETCD